MTRNQTVAEVLTYARSGSSEYDQIAARVAHASLFSGASPLHALAKEVRDLPSAESFQQRRLMDLRGLAQPLSLQAPESGRFAFEMTRERIRLRWPQDGRTVLRRFAPAHAPAVLFQRAQPDPAEPLIGRMIDSAAAAQLDIWWLPFPALVERGRFLRMQECDRVTQQLEPDRYYLFISHRWLDTTHPDPDGGQAAAVAWQLVAYMVEAIWVLAARGREGVRTRSLMGHIHVGPTGSGLAESLVVNLLDSVDDGALAALMREAEAFDDIEADHGARKARQDLGLGELRSRLSDLPLLSALLSRVWLWYDFNCMPQHPCTPEEQQRIEVLLGRLGLVLTLSRTAVLLDDVADYFGRGWCSYEATMANDTLYGALDVWVGSHASIDHPRSLPESFMRVLPDRRHLIWRAILDTEVFGVQAPAECMARLGMSTTRPEDVEIVYDLLRKMGVPSALHYDDGEVVTGILPMPFIDGQLVITQGTSRPAETPKPADRFQIEVPGPAAALARLGPAGLPAWQEFGIPSNGSAAASQLPVAHIAVVGSCEGEAIILAAWVREHLEALQQRLRVRVASLCWLASDVAPVGHFAVGTLTARPVRCDRWIVVGTHGNLDAGLASALLVQTLRRTGIHHIEIRVGDSEAEVTVFAKPAALGEAKLLNFAVDDPALPRGEKALFLQELLQYLYGEAPGAGRLA